MRLVYRKLWFMVLSERDSQLLENFIANVRYYCKYNSKEVPDEEFIRSGWEKGHVLEDLVELFARKKSSKNVKTPPRKQFK